jgi:hypothetical protein
MLLAAYGAMICLMVLVRRQWIEHERLTFPLAQVPISMIGESGAEDSSNLLSDFFGVAGLGGAAQWFLTLASKRWLWFPIHPIAFPISAMWTTHHLMPSIFIAWLVKSVVTTLWRRNPVPEHTPLLSRTHSRSLRRGRLVVCDRCFYRHDR